MPIIRVPKRDHNRRAQAGTDLIQRGIHEIYAAIDDAHDKLEAHINMANHHTVRAASLTDDINAHVTMADKLMDEIEMLIP